MLSQIIYVADEESPKRNTKQIEVRYKTEEQMLFLYLLHPNVTPWDLCALWNVL
jgi:hypothetical protein